MSLSGLQTGEELEPDRNRAVFETATSFMIGQSKESSALHVVLRSSKPEDDAFQLRVYASTRIEEMALVDWSAEQKESFLQMQLTAQRQHYLANYPGAQYYIIERSGQPVGRMIVDRSKDAILLMDIALLPDYRRMGIGTGLIHELLAEADHANLPVQLHVESFNPAMHLYKRLGFRKTGEISFYDEMTRPPQVAGHG